jgi:tetratricopeptide (TPR) repeat protein
MVTLSRDEILKNIAGKSDEIKLEMLEKVTKNIEADQETRKTAFLLMTDIYIKKMWWSNTARAFLNAADLAKTFDEKKDLFFKAGTFFVRSEDYFTAEDTFRKAVVLAAKKDKEPTKQASIEVYANLAKEFESKRMQTKAIAIYQKMLALNLPIERANDIREKIAVLYEKIGKPREARWIREQKASAIEMEKKKVMPVEQDDDEFCAEDLLR